MSSSLLGSWIDLDAATNAARQLCLPQPAPDPADPAASGTDDHPVPQEAPATQPPPALQRRLDDIRGKAQRNGLLAKESRPDPLPVPTAPPARPDGAGLEPFRVPCGPLTARVRALGDWMNESFSPGSLFVADDQGLPLVDFRGSGDLLAAAAVLAEAVQRARRHLPEESGTEVVHLPLAPDQVLSLVSSPTALGTLQAGLTTTAPLGPEAVRLLARALKKTAEPVADPG